MFSVSLRSMAAVARLGCIALQLGGWFFSATAADGANNTVTVMTRNMDAGTDLGYVFAASDAASFARGMASTWAELRDSNFKRRATRLADEIEAAAPDLIALQEVTLWRVGPLLSPPATRILYDQLDLLLTELSKRNLNYQVVVVQTELDAEAPAPTVGMDLRITDRDVVLARQDRPRSEFAVLGSHARQYAATFDFGSPVLGQLSVPCGWISLDVAVNGSRFRFVNTHLQSAMPGVPAAEQTQHDQARELLAMLLPADVPTVLAGDFNANAEPGPEYTGTAQQIVQAGFADAWKVGNPGDAGYTWPLFGEDQSSGPTTPDERIDLIFLTGSLARPMPAVVSAVRTGIVAPFGSDHAGVALKLRLQ
jgi:endonuclease/exonuclease/phosphatase family metal-dependent hydrolase